MTTTTILNALDEGLRYIEDHMEMRGYPEHAEDWCEKHGEIEPDAIYAKRDRLRAALKEARG